MKVKIELAFLGYFPYSSDIEKIENWRSDLFEIISTKEYKLIGNADRNEASEFSDEYIEQYLPDIEDAHILIAVTCVPIQNKSFSRRFIDNKVCISYSAIAEILKHDNIPMENFLLRVLYTMSFVYRKYGNRIPLMTEFNDFTHDATYGCIFDSNLIRTDMIYSTNKPRLCISCINDLSNNHIEINLIEKVQSELKKINNGLYYEITVLAKKYPIWTIIISSLTAIGLGTIGSIIASFIYEKLK